ncbi:transcriptional regulator, TetR family [Lentzea fradiae]|uniref:Transcriptional regulator, TetR family n=1 Tax=Lentzea fradiae TaxID=200378 RepID=A0A1G7K9Q4_9PSEU|nr:TetR family transcriptional regulator [Lentzea fradiae]SDF33886.1 transcriptional regulator, TetR family [Lentzea fradiae]
MAEKEPGLRERTRRAVKAEIAAVAKRLFVERGFEATTIDDIAAVVGMSQRSVFRYFATKEEIVLGGYDAVLADLLAELSARPAGEDDLASLRSVLAFLVKISDPPGHRDVIASALRLVFETPLLYAAYLEKLQKMQDAIVAVLFERARAEGRPRAVDDPEPRVLVAAEFGAFLAAQHSWLALGVKGPFAGVHARAVAVLDAPRGQAEVAGPK